MKYFIYFIEFILTSLAIFGLNLLAKHLLMKKFNEITAAIFAFILVLLTAFLFSPYLMSFPNPEVFYVPILLILLILDLRKAAK